MLKLKWLVLFFLFIAAESCKAQGQNMQQFYQSELHRIAKKAYLLGLSGKINVYLNDSLSSTVSMEDRIKRGARVEERQILGSDGELQDTMVLIPFNPDSVAGDLGLYFKITRKTDGSVSYTPFAVSPYFNIIIGDIHISLPLFNIKWTDFLGHLTNSEKSFMRHYVAWKQMCKPSMYSQAELEECEINWSNYVTVGHINYYSTTPSKTIANVIYTLAKDQLFHNYFNSYRIKLKNENGNEMPVAEFTKTHLKKVALQVSHSYDDDFKDTVIEEMPTCFDTLYFTPSSKSMVCNVGMFNQGSNGQASGTMIKYHFSEADLKKALHPDLYFFCSYYAQNHTQ